MSKRHNKKAASNTCSKRRNDYLGGTNLWKKFLKIRKGRGRRSEDQHSAVDSTTATRQKKSKDRFNRRRVNTGRPQKRWGILKKTERRNGPTAQR